MPEALTPKYKAAVHWSRDKRFREAAKKVVHDEWTQGRAAEWYGVSRQRLNGKVKEYRAEMEKAALGSLRAEISGDQILDAAVRPLGLQESRRVGTFEEFDERYFGRWICPDCGVHHPNPGFHSEIMSELDQHHRRMVINMPPYHAKSTLVTVKHTLYQTVKDPNHRTIIVSKSLPFARTFLRSINQLLTNPELYDGPNLIEDWGPFKPEGDDAVWNQNELYVAGRMTAEKDPTVLAIGVGGQIYGRRADTIKADDCADVANQRNPARVLEMLTWFDKEVSSRIGKSGRLIYVGTRVHPGDIYSTLQHREGYKVLRYPLILDEATDLTLWPEHFDMDMARHKRTEMMEADFQLVYQNIDVPGLGASFTQEIVDQCKNKERVLGHYESGWRLVAGLDLAGGNKDSGYTCGTLMGVDLRTGKRHLVDIFNVKSMRAPQLKEQIFQWCDQYPIYEWRVENNGLQSQIVQYNQEIVNALAVKGIRIHPHHTDGNKWDSTFGVESMAPLYSTNLIDIPWGNAPTRKAFQPLVEQLVVFPMGMISDAVMSHWFADLGCRDLLRRAHLPMFNERMKVPERIKRKRKVIDFGAQQVRSVPMHEQRGATHLGVGAAGYRRMTVGRPTRHEDVVESTETGERPQFVNVSGSPLDESE